ncbi:hypothetical protein JTB14_018151 [Gonioctena quinquepunctata]|nr:hypothetical protein JTB14_018151 [Gonioctena quinquepunctata]
MDGHAGRSRTQKGINKSLNPDSEWPPGFGMSSKPGMDSIRNNLEITEPALETKNTGKTSSKISGNGKATAKGEFTYCNKRGHKIDDCIVFKKDDVDTRWKVVTDRKLCFSCLKNNHHYTTLKCRFRRNCGINNCMRPQNEYLHKEEPKNSTKN